MTWTWNGELKARDAARHRPPHIPSPHIVTAREYNGRSRPQQREWAPDHPVWQERRSRRGDDSAHGYVFVDSGKPDFYLDARLARPLGTPPHLAAKRTDTNQNMWFLMTGETRTVNGETML